MREQSTRELIILSLLSTAAVTLLNLYFAGGDIIETPLLALVFFVMIFFAMRVSNRLGRRIASRGQPPQEPPAPGEPPPPSSERPEHAQRRRQRRRRRGRRRN